MDHNLSVDFHVKNLSKIVYLEIRKLKHMSKFVSENSLKTLAASYILSRLDYCNALFKNMPNFQFEKLQKLQNFAAKVVLKNHFMIMSPHALLTFIGSLLNLELILKLQF